MPLGPGDVFAGYTIVRLLGSGGMGEVYLAQHPRLPRRDALKLLPRDVSADPDFRERFNREADLASTLWHPHIVGVHDRGEADGQLWISMDFVDGVDAARLLANRYPAGMPAHQVVDVVTAVAGALDYAHKQGLLHRDVKPANIMLTHLHDEADRRILLADFGIARNVDDISGLTTTNMTVGTVAYSAPEQLMGEDIDGRADQYALAATAYHLLTGSQLFPHSNPAVVISRHLNATPPPLADTRADLAALDPVLSAALAKDPDDRFACCLDFARALAEQSATSSRGTPLAPTTPAPVRRKSEPAGEMATPTHQRRQEPAATPSAARRWGNAIAASVAAAVLLAGGIALAWRPWQQRHAPTTAPSSAPSSVAPAPSSSTPVPPPPPPPPPPVFPAKAIDSILLSPTEVNNILGTYATNATRGRVGLMKLDESRYGMSDNSAVVTPPECVGVIFTAEHQVYADTGFEAMRDQTFGPEPYVYDPSQTAPTDIQQTVVVFPLAEQAQAVLAASQKWRHAL